MINKILEKIGSQWIFLILVVFLYLILCFFNLSLVKESLVGFTDLFLKIIPAFVVVFFLMFVFSLFFDSKKTSELIGRQAGIKGWLIAIIGGIISMGPIYMWYPLLADLREKGMRNAFIVVFLYNRAVKIPLLPMMIYYFGLPFVVILTFYMILFSIINGILVGKIVKQN